MSKKNTLIKRNISILIGLTLTTVNFPSLVYANNDKATPLAYVSNKAIENNPEVQEAWHAFKSSIYGIDAARSGYLPSVDASASTGYEKRNYGIEDGYSRNTAELTVTQMLYDGFRTSNTVDRFKHIQLVRYFELLSQTERTALDASTAFLDVQRFKELIELAEANLKEHESVYQQIEQSVSAGVARAADLEQITGRLSLAQSNVLTEYANLHDVTARYLKIVGELPLPNIKTANLNEDNIPISIGKALDIAYENSPTFYASLYNIEEKKANAKAQKAAFHPNIDLSARYGTQDKDELGLNETRTEARVGIDISYNLYNGGLDNANLKQAYTDINIAKYQRDSSCIDIRQRLQIAYNNLIILEKKLPILDQHRISSSKVKIAYKDQFDIGQRTLLDVLDAENEYFQSNRSYIVTVYERQSSILTMLTEMGKLLPTLHVMSDKYPTLKELTDDPIIRDAENICPSYDVAATLNRITFLDKKAKLDDDNDGIINKQDICPSTPSSTNVDLSGCTIYNEGNSKIEIGIPFFADASDVRDEYIQEIEKLAYFLRDNPDKKVEIQGHTSLDGDEDYNRKLSEKRAFSVAEILIKKFNIKPARVKSFGYGIDQPRINEISVKANAANRRIEAVITDN
ncbi:TolC family outer membrane protein [Pseudoalteromonas sp. SWXJZ94C]|uniref:TolC family outer membrane protein n=1 Tax=Pseudoalteromonas sp. SWXJZ94C TaxID=2792065 RepID=UPI0018CF2EEA|nr:TolC family outer membrane protein [Pseudoalteromonas sp. SWXJZ94C]MBH0057321.1 TolC family outer membrane protein [Pseudoalteromonas sp. SWXJZ94C]